MMQRVLADRHHHGLFYSLQRLFENRLGMQLFTPVGHAWWDEGYWRFGEVYGDDRLARQYLSTDGWERVLPEYLTGVWKTIDGHHPDRAIYGIELAQARKAEWSHVVASVQDNQEGFARFAQEVGAQYVLQVGNTNQDVDWRLDPLAIVSSEVPILGRGVKVHQEFDSDSTFAYRNPEPSKTIRSFVNCFSSTPVYDDWLQAQIALPDWEFVSHGIDGQNIETVQEIADLMAGSAFGWHDKVQGDGFGHVIHQWAAIGRPLIGHASHYEGLMAEPFWQDGVTCIDLDRHSIPETARIVAGMDVGGHRAMCEAIRAVFDSHVDYETEADSIRSLLAREAVAV